MLQNVTGKLHKTAQRKSIKPRLKCPKMSQRKRAGFRYPMDVLGELIPYGCAPDSIPHVEHFAQNRPRIVFGVSASVLRVNLSRETAKRTRSAGVMGASGACRCYAYSGMPTPAGRGA
jgi:hypothetical protein